jgi:murein DD-endopeptidase MepM/ murein hydrolase activator NlpD
MPPCPARACPHPRPDDAAARAPARIAACLGVVAALVIVIAAGPRPLPAAADGGGGVVSYVPPVDAPVVDPFHLPTTPYGPGNRGLDYDAVPGTPVRASADGVVLFAGQVGGTLHVTLRHADGIRTSYSFLARIAVVLGQRLHQGDPVGTAGERFHFGARSGDVYVDPAGLFAGADATLALLPLDAVPAGPPGPPPVWLRAVDVALRLVTAASAARGP